MSQGHNNCILTNIVNYASTSNHRCPLMFHTVCPTYRSSFDASGNSLFFFKSVRAMMATSSPFSLTMGSLPEQCTHNKLNQRECLLKGYIHHFYCFYKLKRETGKKYSEFYTRCN